MRRDDMPLQPGTTLGPYQILALIGAGGMGEVYRANDTKLKRRSASGTVNVLLNWQAALRQ